MILQMISKKGSCLCLEMVQFTRSLQLHTSFAVDRWHPTEMLEAEIVLFGAVRQNRCDVLRVSNDSI